MAEMTSSSLPAHLQDELLGRQASKEFHQVPDSGLVVFGLAHGHVTAATDDGRFKVVWAGPDGWVRAWHPLLHKSSRPPAVHLVLPNA